MHNIPPPKAQPLKSKSGRLLGIRQAQPVIKDTKQFMIDMFSAWKNTHKLAKEQGLSDADIGLAFYKALEEIFGKRY